MASVPLVVMEDIGLRLGGAPVLNGVSLAIPRGTTLALLGASGCGKTTLARIALGLVQPDTGKVRFDGDELTGRRIRRSHRRRMSMVFQDPRASLNPRWQVRDSIAEPLHAFRLVARQTDPYDRVAELLHLVGLPRELGRRWPADLSPGQVQRVAIARALASDPIFLVCDEPTSALDVSVQAHVLNLLRGLQERLGLTMMFISHDVGVVRHMADLVAVMHRGHLLEFGAADAMFAAPRHPCTRDMLLPLPPAAPPAAAPASAGGHGEGGCVFLRQCKLATARCAAETPALRYADGSAVACHAVEEGRC